MDEHQNLIGEGDLRAQALRAFQNLEMALAAAGAKTSDVVKLNIYVKDYQPENALSGFIWFDTVMTAAISFSIGESFLRW